MRTQGPGAAHSTEHSGCLGGRRKLRGPVSESRVPQGPLLTLWGPQEFSLVLSLSGAQLTGGPTPCVAQVRRGPPSSGLEEPPSDPKTKPSPFSGRKPGPHRGEPHASPTRPGESAVRPAHSSPHQEPATPRLTTSPPSAEKLKPPPAGPLPGLSLAYSPGRQRLSGPPARRGPNTT